MSLDSRVKKQQLAGLLQSGKFDEARSFLEQRCTENPRDGESWMQLVNVNAQLGNFPGVEQACNRLITLYPSAAEPYLHLATALLLQNRKEEAELRLRKAAECQPDNPVIWFRLGKALHMQARYNEALKCYEKSVALKPDLAEALDSMGSIFKSRGQITHAIECYRQCVAVRPDFHPGHSDLVVAYNYTTQYKPDFVYHEHLRWGERHRLAGDAGGRHENVPDPAHRLRIGYVSPDFYCHSVAYFFEPLLGCHNHGQFEIFCYADAVKVDAVTERLKQQADHWQVIQGLSDQQVADLVRSHGIDILVDLTGHTANSRLRVFTAKPAPVQVSYLGYPNTTGLKQMDYRISDSHADPEGTTEQWHSETLQRLAGGFLCYRPSPDAPPVSGLPALEHGYITFGSFNNLAKISPDVVAVWAQILLAVPTSRLIIKNIALADSATRARFQQMFEALGIEPGRVDLRPPVPAAEGHLKTYSEVDIGLDSFPYNGTTTTCEALWMGVPVVTLSGDTHVARVGTSLLHRVGLDDLVAERQTTYVEVAVEFAGNLKQLARIRGGLRETMHGSSLCDGKRIARELESAYRDMWSTWCQLQ